MRDIFLCPNGNMLDNWKKAFPKALVAESLVSVPVNEPVVFWVHANSNNVTWLENTLKSIDTKFKASKTVVLANTPNQIDALAVMRKGAVGYCHAYSVPSVLKELKTVVMHGGVWLGNDLLKTLIAATTDVIPNKAANVEKALEMLTKRQKEVALEAAKGLSNKEVARVLNITERTVKAHVSATLEKLGVKDRLQLALLLNEKEATKQKPENRLKVVTQSKTSQVNQSSNTTKKKLESVA